jgi:hypothetical protein
LKQLWGSANTSRTSKGEKGLTYLLHLASNEWSAQASIYTKSEIPSEFGHDLEDFFIIFFRLTPLAAAMASQTAALDCHHA